MASNIIDGLDVVIERLQSIPEEFTARAILAAKEIASLLEQYAIMHHPWQQRTGATNITTRAVVVPDMFDHIVYVVLSAGMPYDLYLEQFYEGKWSWLKPAILANEEEIRETLARNLQNDRFLLK